MSIGHRVRTRHHIGDHDKGAGIQGAADLVCIGQRDDRIGRHDPQGLDLPVSNGIEEVNCLEARTGRHIWCVPEAADAADIVRLEIHMAGQLVCEAAHFAATHRIRLPGDRERPHARLPDTAGHQVAIDDRVDLVRPG